MKKVILFEGADSVGKSTTVKTLMTDPTFKGSAHHLKLNKYTRVNNIRTNINKELPIDLQINMMHEMFEVGPSGMVLVLDRFLPSNIAYDAVMQGMNVDLSLEYYFDVFLKDFDVFNVFLTRSPISNSYSDADIKMSKDQYNKVLAEYDYIVEQLRAYGSNVIQHNLVEGVNDVKETLNSIKRWI